MDENIAEVINAYNKDAETYDDIESEAFYANQYELYDKHLNKLKPYIKGDVLDLGCGTGIQTVFLANHANKVLGIDITYALLEKALGKTCKIPNIQLFHGDAVRLPFKDSSFDFISSYGEVISHIPNYEEAFREVARVIKPEGVFVFSVLNKWNIQLIYSPEELKAAFQSKKKGQWRKWQCLYPENNTKVSLNLKTFSFGELKDLLMRNDFTPFSFIGIHTLSLLVPLRLQYGTMNFWGKIFRLLGKVDMLINEMAPMYKFGYTIMVAAKSKKI